jgi:hypothetical protein
LDSEHVLEPVDGPPLLGPLGREPLVRDVRGRMWRVRWRPQFLDGLAGPAVVIAVVVLALLIALVLGL